jgi:hypothetical protein
MAEAATAAVAAPAAPAVFKKLRRFTIAIAASSRCVMFEQGNSESPWPGTC